MINKQPIVAITGANGFLGKTLVNHFAKNKWHVVALVRNPSKYQDEPNIQYKKYDITKPINKETLSNADYVVHTAYIKQSRSIPDTFDINVDGAKKLLEASRASGVKKNIFISSMSAHNEATSSYGKQKLFIESLFNTKSDISLRPGLIIGNGGIVKNMLLFMKRWHVVPLVGGGKQPLQIIGVDDLATIIEKALTQPLHGVFSVASGRVYSYREFYTIVARQRHIRVILIPVPFSLLLTAARLLQWLRIPVNINPDNVRGLQKLRSTDTSKDLSKFGTKLESLEAALAKTA